MGKPVDLRGFILTVAVGADCLIGMIITHDINDVGALGFLLFGMASRKNSSDKEQNKKIEEKSLHCCYF